LRVETYRHGLTVVGYFDGVFGLAGFGGGGGNFQLAFFQAQADGSGTLVGKLGYAGYGGSQFFAMEGYGLGDVFGQHGFVVGELASWLARGQETRPYAEEERGLDLGDVD